jgi:CRISPR-associated protein Cmr4
MNVWNETAILGIYTLTPTHFGTGQTTGAVDLPIARDAATGFPVLPATGIKGVLRDYAGRGSQPSLAPKGIKDLFGGELDADNKAENLQAGRLVFTEARLLAYPVRSLNRPFLHVTCPLILEGLARDLRAVGGEALLKLGELSDKVEKALVADPKLAQDTLVLEDLAYAGTEVAHSKAMEDLSKLLATLIPAVEKATRERFEKGLVVIPDEDFRTLLEYVVPVQARIQLTGGKTTDKWKDPATGKIESGNLWYEERLPSDCLFVTFIGERRGRENGTAGLQDLMKAHAAFAVVQIGGNETVGNGLCLCNVLCTPSSTGGEAR